jgi:hypothetical protein
MPTKSTKPVTASPQLAPGELLTMEDFARRNRISTRTIYNMIAEGKGPAVLHIRGARRITQQAEAEWREQLQSASKTDTPKPKPVVTRQRVRIAS